MMKAYTDKYTAKYLEVIRRMRGAWSMTLQRCRNPRCRDYRHYGGRGITVCSRWLRFENFLEDMGLRPEGMTLERVDNTKGYSPDNCIWATRATQANNTRLNVVVEWQGERKTVAQWERSLGWKAGTLKARLSTLNYTTHEAFTKPVKPGEKSACRVYPKKKPIDKSKLPRGIDHPRTAISKESVAYCREMHSRGSSFSSLAREYGVSVKTMIFACKGLKAYKGI